MITKEHKTKKYCCFYASDFHLEMILLPYIKNNIDKTKFMIFTEEDLSESMKILLNRTNLGLEEKDKLISLNWNKKNEEQILQDNLNDYTIIIKGDKNYISKINNKILETNNKINIIDCYNIDDKEINFKNIKKNYDAILNTEVI